MPAPPRMQGWPVGASVAHALLLPLKGSRPRRGRFGLGAVATGPTTTLLGSFQLESPDPTAAASRPLRA